MAYPYPYGNPYAQGYFPQSPVFNPPGTMQQPTARWWRMSTRFGMPAQGRKR